ncbi:hypothetical protein GPUN_2592 [Glaciecola punicea ACAM 611]|uniref:Uncharacterized protein n=1 Tax=Glaciecola punicea ACAM 611 TaxID=1121923 RepID=H5TEI0_9ALTE|nr:hypothetical protein GPUN_2592 [Glaciecola punicea ACAM 611]
MKKQYKPGQLTYINVMTIGKYVCLSKDFAYLFVPYYP